MANLISKKIFISNASVSKNVINPAATKRMVIPSREGISLASCTCEAFEEQTGRHNVQPEFNTYIESGVSKFGTNSWRCPSYLEPNTPGWLLLRGKTEADRAVFQILSSVTDTQIWSFFFLVPDIVQESPTAWKGIIGTGKYEGYFGIENTWNNNALRFRDQINSIETNLPTYTPGVWHHIAFIRKENIVGVYMDGIQRVYYINPTPQTILYSTNEDGIAVGSNFQRYNNINVSSLQVISGNYFNASPNSGLTDTIEVPTGEIGVLT